MSRVPRTLRRIGKLLLDAAWKVLVLPTQIGTLAGTMSMLHLSRETRSAEDVAADAVNAQRMHAQVGASPTDRDLARALPRSRELPAGMAEVWREWTPLDPSTPVVVSIRQQLARREGRIRPRTTTQVLLELSRFRDEDSAVEAMSVQPTSKMPDGGRLRAADRGVRQDIEAYTWSRSEGGVWAERVLQLRLRRGTALAILLAQTNSPDASWESEIRDLMRTVGERLR